MMDEAAEWLQCAALDYRALVPAAATLPDFLRVARRFSRRVASARPIRAIALHDVPRRPRFKRFELEDLFNGPYWHTTTRDRRGKPSKRHQAVPAPVERQQPKEQRPPQPQPQQQLQQRVQRPAPARRPVLEVHEPELSQQEWPAPVAAAARGAVDEHGDLLDGRYWALEPNSRRAMRQLRLQRKRERSPQVQLDDIVDDDDDGDDNEDSDDHDDGYDLGFDDMASASDASFADSPAVIASSPSPAPAQRHSARAPDIRVAFDGDMDDEGDGDAVDIDLVSGAGAGGGRGGGTRAAVPLDKLMPQDPWLDGPLSVFNPNSKRFMRRLQRLGGGAGSGNARAAQPARPSQNAEVDVEDDRSAPDGRKRHLERRDGGSDGTRGEPKRRVQESGGGGVARSSQPALKMTGFGQRRGGGANRGGRGGDLFPRRDDSQEAASSALDALIRAQHEPVVVVSPPHAGRVRAPGSRKARAPARHIPRTASGGRGGGGKYVAGDRVVASWSVVAGIGGNNDDDGAVGLDGSAADANQWHMWSARQCVQLDCSSMDSDSMLRNALRAVQQCDVLESPWIAWHALRGWFVRDAPPRPLVLAAMDKMVDAFARDAETAARHPSSLCIWVELYRRLGVHEFWNELLARCGERVELAWRLFHKLQCLPRLVPVDVMSGAPEYELRDAVAAADWLTVDKLLRLEREHGSGGDEAALRRCVALAALWQQGPPASLVARFEPALGRCRSIPDWILCCDDTLPATPVADDCEWALWLKLLVAHLRGRDSADEGYGLLRVRDSHQANACVAVCAVAALAEAAAAAALPLLVRGCSLLGLSCVARALLWRGTRAIDALVGPAAFRQAQLLCSASQSQRFSPGACEALRWWRAAIAHPRASDSLGAALAPVLGLFLDACRPGRLSARVLAATCMAVRDASSVAAFHVGALHAQLMSPLARVAAFSWDRAQESVLSCVADAAGELLAHACARGQVGKEAVLDFVDECKVDRRRAFSLKVAQRGLLSVQPQQQPQPVGAPPSARELSAWAMACGSFASLSPAWHQTLQAEWTALLFGADVTVNAALRVVQSWGKGDLCSVVLAHLASRTTAASVALVCEACVVLAVAVHRFALADVARRWAGCGLADASQALDATRMANADGSAAALEALAKAVPSLMRHVVNPLAHDEWARNLALTLARGAASKVFRDKDTTNHFGPAMQGCIKCLDGAVLELVVRRVFCPLLLCTVPPKGAAPDCALRKNAATVFAVGMCHQVLTVRAQACAPLIAVCAARLVANSRRGGGGVVFGFRERRKACKLLAALPHDSALVLLEQYLLDLCDAQWLLAPAAATTALALQPPPPPPADVNAADMALEALEPLALEAGKSDADVKVWHASLVRDLLAYIDGRREALAPVLQRLARAARFLHPCVRAALGNHGPSATQ